MARFLQWSDLHREWGGPFSQVPFPMPTHDCPASSIDAILVAGDLHSGVHHVESLQLIFEAWGVPVISIAGNHEYYNQNVQASEAQQRAYIAEVRQKGYDVMMLDRDAAIIGDTRILGCTLWTDFDLLGDREDMMAGARHLMRDYHKVLFTEDGKERLMLPSDTRKRHLGDRAWLLGELSKPWSKRTLVMTHHIPVPEALAAESGKGGYAPAYCSDMRADILDKKIDVWVSGHSHWARRGTLPGLHGPIAFTANMQGYPATATSRAQHTNFEPYRVIDTCDPTLGLAPIEINEPSLRRLMSADQIQAGMSPAERPSP